MTKAQADEVMAEEIALAKQSLAMPTTGNAEQDDAHIHDCARSTCMIAAGFCPNGCGKMNVEESQMRVVSAECPVCNFTYRLR